jgi:hypothetical protein
VEFLRRADVDDWVLKLYGVGFVVVHAAPARSYVLVCWWSDENEIHQRMFSAPAGRPESLAPHDGAAIGCVWELAVTDFERRAWLAHVLARPAGPDLAEEPAALACPATVWRSRSEVSVVHACVDSNRQPIAEILVRGCCEAAR